MEKTVHNWTIHNNHPIPHRHPPPLPSNTSLQFEAFLAVALGDLLLAE
jgi:hypothetical protein